MIRFVNLTGQLTLEDDEFYFAWFDTVTDRFLSFYGEQVFSSWDNFREAFLDHLRDKSPIHDHRDLSRFYGLYSRNRQIGICEFAERMIGRRLLPWQEEVFKALNEKRDMGINIGRGIGKTWVYKVIISYIASKAVGDFVQWVVERSKE